MNEEIGEYFEGQLPLEEWKKLYYLRDGLWYLIPQKPKRSPLRYIKDPHDLGMASVCFLGLGFGLLMIWLIVLQLIKALAPVVK